MPAVKTGHWVSLGRTHDTQPVNEAAEKIRDEHTAAVYFLQFIRQRFYFSSQDIDSDTRPACIFFVYSGGMEIGCIQHRRNGN